MRRRLFNLAAGGAAAVSLVLCAAVAALWTRAQFASDWRTVHAGAYELRAWTITTCLYFQCSTPPYHTVASKTGPAFHGWSYSNFVRPRMIDWKDVSGHPRTYMWLGFSLQPTYCQPRCLDGTRALPDTWFTEVGMPFYAMFGLTAVLPALRVRQWLTRRRRHRLNLCLTCGYDLRATARAPQEGGALLDRCPECGAVPAPAR